MRRSVVALLLIVVIVGGGLWYGENHYKSPCDDTVAYKIGNIDPRFNLSEGKLKSDIDEALNLWRKTNNKELFTLTSDAKLTVNLVYDERQALNSQIVNQEANLKTDQGTIASQVSAYKAQVADFNNRVAALNAEIKDWNSKGGAPADVYDQIVAEEKSLESEQVQLNALAKSLNLQTQNYNAQVVRLNGTIDTFNSNLAVKPEEGIYDGQKQVIDIYFIVNHDELIHTLAHEFGHALGMNHVSDSKAIMYKESSSSVKLTNDDLNEIQRVCKEENLVDYYLNKFRQTYNVSYNISL